MSDLTTAIKIACEAHANQKDKAGEPYILHPLRLMQRLKDKGAMIRAKGTGQRGQALSADNIDNNS